ncbi:MAG: glycosyl transferase, partial [Clostridium perfringens]
DSIYFDTKRTIEDWFPIFKEIYKSKKIVFVNKPLYYYRQRESSALHQKSIKKINDYNFAVKSILTYIKKENMKIDEKKYFDFIAKVQATEISDYTDIDKNIKNDVYKKYKLCELNNYQCLFRIKCGIKSKIKLILYNLNILHYAYKFKK